MSEITYDTNPIEAYDREIKRYEEQLYTLGNEFVDPPNKEFLASDLSKFLEGYPQVKVDIEHYICHRLEQLRAYLQELSQEYCKRIKELEQQLKEKENDKEKD